VANFKPSAQRLKPGGVSAFTARLKPCPDEDEHVSWRVLQYEIITLRSCVAKGAPQDDSAHSGDMNTDGLKKLSGLADSMFERDFLVVLNGRRSSRPCRRQGLQKRNIGDSGKSGAGL
jgi:hypothetical protein